MDRKRKLTGCVQQYEPKTKKPRVAMASQGKAAFDSAGQPLAKKPALQQPVLTCSGNRMPVSPLGSALRSLME